MPHILRKIKPRFKELIAILNFAKNHKPLIYAETRKIGIKDTIIGWGLIAFSGFIALKVSSQVAFSIRFLIIFLTATLILYIQVLFKGKGYLKIKSVTEEHRADEQFQFAHLSIRLRKAVLYLRGVLAVISYIAYSWTKANDQFIDNSALFSADALIFALISYFVLKTYISKIEVLGIIIAFVGVCSIFSMDFSFQYSLNSIFCGLSGLLASTTLAIIILLNSIIVQHEPPLRIAFYQCFIGLIISACLIPVDLYFGQLSAIYLSSTDILYLAVIGVVYALALLLFFEAFLYTEPLIIGLLGYSIFPFATFFSFLSSSALHLKDLLSSAVIVLGSGITIFGQYREDKKKVSANYVGIPIYLDTLKEKMKSLRTSFKRCELGLSNYMAQKNEFNKLLFEFSEELNGTDIQNIDIERQHVIFTIKPYNLRLISDEAGRSAPFEILNFGKYENDDASLAYKLIKEDGVIIDIGAHIGWYTLNFAKRFPRAEVYAFEPIHQTFEILNKNLALNELRNVKLFNFGIYDENTNKTFYYFKGGSVLSNKYDLIKHGKIEKVKREVRRLDDVIQYLNISKKVDLIKCDIEGAELFALKGAENTIKKDNPIIFIELCPEWCQRFNYEPNDVIQFLAKLGYDCFKIQKGKLKRTKAISKRESEKHNYFFLHKASHKTLIKKNVIGIS